MKAASFNIFSIRTLCLNIYYENIVIYFGFAGVKIYKIKKNNFFLPTSNKFVIQNNPLMQVRLIFHKTVNKSKLKV